MTQPICGVQQKHPTVCIPAFVNAASKYWSVSVTLLGTRSESMMMVGCPVHACNELRIPLNHASTQSCAVLTVVDLPAKRKISNDAFFKIKVFFLGDILILKIIFLIVKINIFWGDLSDISAKTATLKISTQQ